MIFVKIKMLEKLKENSPYFIIKNSVYKEIGRKLDNNIFTITQTTAIDKPVSNFLGFNNII